MDKPVKYAMGLGGKIHKRWMTPLGPIRVMGEPVEGYVMARRPQAVPFVLTVAELFNAARRPHQFGPFEAVGLPPALASQKKGDGRG